MKYRTIVFIEAIYALVHWFVSLLLLAGPSPSSAFFPLICFLLFGAVAVVIHLILPFFGIPWESSLGMALLFVLLSGWNFLLLDSLMAAA